MRVWLFIGLLLLAGCSHHTPPSTARLSDPVMVISRLNDQLRQWRGVPYRYGGLSPRGIDCSGFVWMTFRDRFHLQLPRTTSAQMKMGSPIDKNRLRPGDLVFFRTGRGEQGLHVGIYTANDQFIHASTRRGVTRSSLNNRYWRDVFWQARRL